MWSALWNHSLSIMDWNLRLGFYFLLLATGFRVGLAFATRFAGTWIHMIWRLIAPSQPYIASRIVKVGVELPSVSRILISLMIFSTGWIASSLQQYNRTHTYRDVGIVAQYAPDNFLLRFVGDSGILADWSAIICPGYTATWKPGEKLEFLTIVDRGPCWDLSGGHYKYYKKDGKAIKFAELTNENIRSGNRGD